MAAVSGNESETEREQMKGDDEILSTVDYDEGLCHTATDRPIRLYVIECQGLFKVGLSRDFDLRKHQMQTGNPFPLRGVMTRAVPDEAAALVERYAHWLLDDHRVRGEWFSAAELTVRKAVLEAVGRQRVLVAEARLADQERENGHKPCLRKNCSWCRVYDPSIGHYNPNRMEYPQPELH